MGQQLGEKPAMKTACRLLLVLLCTSSAMADTILLPRLKPQKHEADVVQKPKPTLPLIRFPASTEGWPADEVRTARRACMEKLRGLDLEFQTLAPIGRKGSCGTPAPVLITSIAGVGVKPPAEANCDLAEALHQWIAWSVKPAAAEHLKKKLTVINNASAYVCRRRNNSATGKLSEHAIVNALDISTLGFDDGSAISIKGEWSGLKQLIGVSANGAFLRIIRKFACIRFSTVLGPGSDPHHGDHFHVDLQKRKGGYRICQ